MITDKILKSNGYKKYRDLLYNAKCLFQKKIVDEHGIKYFISFYKYDYNPYKNQTEYEIRVYNQAEKYRFECLWYAITYEMTVKEIEEEIEDVWKKMGSHYYERWD